MGGPGGRSRQPVSARSELRLHTGGLPVPRRDSSVPAEHLPAGNAEPSDSRGGNEIRRPQLRPRRRGHHDELGLRRPGPRSGPPARRARAGTGRGAWRRSDGVDGREVARRGRLHGADLRGLVPLHHLRRRGRPVVPVLRRARGRPGRNTAVREHLAHLLHHASRPNRAGLRRLRTNQLLQTPTAGDELQESTDRRHPGADGIRASALRASEPEGVRLPHPAGRTADLPHEAAHRN